MVNGCKVSAQRSFYWSLPSFLSVHRAECALQRHGIWWRASADNPRTKRSGPSRRRARRQSRRRVDTWDENPCPVSANTGDAVTDSKYNAMQMFIGKVRNKLSLGFCIILCKCKPSFKNFHTVHVPLSPPNVHVLWMTRTQRLRLGPLKISSRIKNICSLGLHLFSLHGRVMQGPGCASCVVCWGRLIFLPSPASPAQPSPAQPSPDGCGANRLCSRDLQWITRHQHQKQLRCCFCVQDCRMVSTVAETLVLMLKRSSYHGSAVVQYSVSMSRHLS